MSKTAVALTLVLVLAGLQGCASSPDTAGYGDREWWLFCGIWVDGGNLQGPARQLCGADRPGWSIGKTAVSAGALCGLVAAVTGGSEKNVAASAGICAAAGAIGASMANRGLQAYREDVSSANQGLSAARRDVDAQIRANQQAERDVARLQQEYQLMQQSVRDDRAFLSEAARIQAQLDEQLQQARERTQAQRDSITLIEQAIFDIEQQMKNAPNKRELEAMRADLQRERERVQIALEESNGLITQIEAEQRRVAAGIKARS